MVSAVLCPLEFSNISFTSKTFESHLRCLPWEVTHTIAPKTPFKSANSSNSFRAALHVNSIFLNYSEIYKY